MDNLVAQFYAWLVALLLALAMMIAWRAGWSMGRRLPADHGESSESKFDDASLALLSLLLAFTFAMSLSKHETRRTMVVADSNSIGDFYTCASLLKEPVRTKLQAVIRDYTALRVDLARQSLDNAAFESALQRMELMQGQMTDLVAEAVASGTPIAVSLTNTLNSLTSNHAARRAAVRDRLPSSIVILLFVAAIVSTALVGREQGAVRKTEVSGTIGFILLVAFAVYVTLDLNQPERGLITVSQEPIQRLLSTISR